MPDFRRYYIKDAIVFITCVTFQRNHYLEGRQNLDLFRQTLNNVQRIHSFHLLAYVILPDHFHWLLRVNEDSSNFSEVMQSVKRNFTNNYKRLHGIRDHLQIWQDRFWDHVIRDEADLERHFDYIHWNPVKHQYASSPEAWKESSLQYWIGKGYYPASWMQHEQPPGIVGLDIGE